MNPLVYLWSSRTEDDMPASPANQLIYPAVVNFVTFTDHKDIVHSSISPSMKLLPNQVVCRKSMAECSTPTLLSTCLCILESWPVMTLTLFPKSQTGKSSKGLGNSISKP